MGEITVTTVYTDPQDKRSKRDNIFAVNRYDDDGTLLFSERVRHHDAATLEEKRADFLAQLHAQDIKARLI